ncbi:MAG: tRNA(adenine34) deaminase [Francisella sp.]|jgi:tRNA(adenine34) deaminase
MTNKLSKHEFFMQKAYEQALLAYENGEVPIGAVLVKTDDADKKVIAESFNKTLILTDPTAHAEMLVIKKAAQQVNNHRLVDTTLYVTMEPCMMCLGAIVQARVSEIVYACDDLRVGVFSKENYHLNKNINHNLQVTNGIMATQCSELLRKFFKERRK